METKRRFTENLNEHHGITLMKFSYNGKEFKIKTTNHSKQRYEERGINLDVACGDIVALGKERLYNYAETGDDVAIIDRDNNIAVIITFEGDQIRIRTIIARANIYVKSGTKIFNLKKENLR